MRTTTLGASWAYRGQDRWAERGRLLRLVEALRPIHPFLHEFSWTGKRSGWKPMLEQPLLHDLTDTQWHEKILKDDGAILVRQFWNRRKPKNEGLSIWLNIFDPEPDYLDHTRTGGGVSFRYLPDVLLTEPISRAMLEAVITAMQPDSADIGTSFWVAPSIDQSKFSETDQAIIRLYGHDPSRPDYAEWAERAKQLDGGIDSPIWRFWLADGQPWPKSGLSRLEAWQSEPADEEEHCLGGTLYTWHKYAPWNLPPADQWSR